MTIPSLSARIGRDLLDRLVDAHAADENAQALHDEVAGILAAHLAELRGLGVVKPHTSLSNRRINLVHSWNVMCGTATHPYSTQEQETRQVAMRLERALVGMPVRMLAFDVGKERITAGERDGKTAAIMAAMDTGDVGWWNIGAREHDFVTGEELSYEMTGWNLVFGTIEDRRRDLVPAADVEPVGLHEVEIDMPTGDLLFADWFRPDGFTDLVDEGNPWRGGSQVENEADAERYARDHGFVSVCSIRRSLSILTDGARITVGSHDEDGDHPLPDGFARKADLFIDLRKVSIVDRASLLATLSRIHDADTATRLADGAAMADGVKRIAVEPGRYRISSSGRGYIEDLLDAGDPLRVEGYEPVLVMERVGPAAGREGEGGRTADVQAEAA